MEIATTTKQIAPRAALETITTLVINNLQSAHSKRAYARQLGDFLAFTQENGYGFNRTSVQAYRQSLADAGKAAASINQALAAIRCLAHEARIHGFLTADDEALIHEVRTWKAPGERLGNWLSLDDVTRLWSAPDTKTLKGLRDKVVLGLLFWCGLRREEACHLDWASVVWLGGTLVLRNICGKGNKTRSIVVHEALHGPLTAWRACLGHPSEGGVLRAVNRHGSLSSRSLDPASVYAIVRDYAEGMGLRFAPHDLRRTMATFMNRGGCPLPDITNFLGHSDPKTTARYISKSLNLQKPPCSYVELKAAPSDEYLPGDSVLSSVAETDRGKVVA